MTVKARDENGEIVYYEDIVRIYEKIDHIVLEDIFGNQSVVEAILEED